MKTDNQNKNGKEISVVYGEDSSINVNIFNNKISQTCVPIYN